MTQKENIQSQPKTLTRFFVSRAKPEHDFRTPILGLHRFLRKPEPGEDCEYLSIYELKAFVVLFCGTKHVTMTVLKKELEKMGFEEGSTEIEERPRHGYKVIFSLFE